MSKKKILNMLLLNKVEELEKLWFSKELFKKNKSLWIENLYV